MPLRSGRPNCRPHGATRSRVSRRSVARPCPSRAANRSSSRSMRRSKARTSSTSASSMRRLATLPSTPVSSRPLPAIPRLPISTATRASCVTAATTSMTSPTRRTSLRRPTCCCTGPAQRRAEMLVRLPHHPPHDGARATAIPLSRFPAPFAPDGHHGRRRRLALGLLP